MRLLCPHLRAVSGAFLCILALALATAPALRAQQIEIVEPETTADTSDQAQEASGLIKFINSMPDLIDQDLPFLESGGSYWLYGRPHFGNPFNGNYFRLDAGGWLKVTDHLDLNLGAQCYVGRDPDDGNEVRYGFFNAYTGLKYEQSLPGPLGTAMSAGVNFSTPVSIPPVNFTDGYRHTDPFATYTRPLRSDIHLIGYASVGLDLLNHSNMPSNFGTNELHSDSVGAAVGASREWRKFSASLTFNAATTALMSNEGHQRFELDPSIYVPLHMRWLHGLKTTLTLEGKAVRGPDGTQFGGGVNVHVSIESHHHVQ
jgi:hypothetical protein